MPKKVKRPGNPNPLDPAAAGVDLDAVLDSIRPHLSDYRQKDLAEAMGVTAVAFSHVLNGHRPPTIGFVASLASVIGGQVSVTFQPPKQ